MATIVPVNRDDATGEVRRVGDMIFTERGEDYGGPSAVMIRVPELAERFDRLRQYLVHESSLTRPLQQIAILIVVRKFLAQYAWQVRVTVCRELGVAEEIIEAVREGCRPNFTDAKNAAVYDFVRELLDTNRICDETHGRAREVLGEEGVIELVGLVGLYTMLSFTCNAFEPPLMPDGPTPLAESVTPLRYGGRP